MRSSSSTPTSSSSRNRDTELADLPPPRVPRRRSRCLTGGTVRVVRTRRVRCRERRQATAEPGSAGREPAPARGAREPALADGFRSRGDARGDRRRNRRGAVPRHPGRRPLRRTARPRACALRARARAPPGGAGGEERGHDEGALLPRRRDLRPLRAGRRRRDPRARGVPDRVHAVPGGDEPRASSRRSSSTRPRSAS